MERIYLDHADQYAKRYSGCTKVSVGAVIIHPGGAVASMGANRTLPDLCRSQGCLRVKLYGNNDKVHRSPSDCRAVHAEVDAIAKTPTTLRGATMYVTRYPCEACARAIVSAGIKRVVYGRKQGISDQTHCIFDYGEVTVKHLDNWEAEDAEN
jgi:dCMP deaminase